MYETDEKIAFLKHRNRDQGQQLQSQTMENSDPPARDNGLYLDSA